MKISLIDYTGKGWKTIDGNPDPWYAADIMIFTKNTRVKMGPDGFEKIRNWPIEKKEAELQYMANTIRASWEFVDYTFMMEDVTRAFTHQVVRHRTGSYAQQTMQILNVKGFTEERPDFLRKYGEVAAENKSAIMKCHSPKSAEMQAVWDSAIRTIAQAYDRLHELGATTEEARGLLPTNIHTNIVCKWSLRTVIDIIHARVSPRNLGEFRDVAVAMRDAIIEVHPWASIFLEQTKDKVTRTLDEGLVKIRDDPSKATPELATHLLKQVDQIRRG